MMLKESSASLKDGHIYCNAKWLFDERNKVNKEDQFKVSFIL